MTMMDDPDLADLERRLRDACRETIPQLMTREASGPAGVPPFESDTFDLVRGEHPPAGHRWLAAAAAVVLVVGAVFLIARSMDIDRVAAPGSSGVPSQDGQVATSTTVPMLDLGTPDPLPVAQGVTDYYVHAGGLGSPTRFGHRFEDLTRCVQLSADGTVCEQIEGIAGVPMVAYDVDGGTVEIGTTFAAITPEDYARQWGPTPAAGNGPTEAVTVRGHHAIRYLNEDRPAVVWTERPNVLAWVAVSPDLESRLLEFAEDLHVNPGPATIPHRVVVPGLMSPWDASDNNSDGFVVSLHQSTECIGFGSTITCARFFVIPRDGTVLVGGSTQLEYPEVRVTYAGGSVTTGTVGLGSYTSRFFLVEVPSPEALSVEWVGDPADEIAGATTTTIVFDLTVPSATTILQPPATVSNVLDETVVDGATDPTWASTTTTTLPPGVTAPPNEALLTTGMPPPTTAPSMLESTTTTITVLLPSG